MTFDHQTLKQQIPYYLTAKDRRVLINELEAISQGGNAEYLLSPYYDSFGEAMLQGDGWRGFTLFSFKTGKKRSVKGLILSNTCDIDPSNLRDFPTWVTFSPLVKLADYVKLLRESGIMQEKIEAKLDAIKSQKTTNIFYIPAGQFLRDDYIVRLDQVYSMPVEAHVNNPDRQKIFRLNNTGFYMLILKLSIHFCRFHEGINRK